MLLSLNFGGFWASNCVFMFSYLTIISHTGRIVDEAAVDVGEADNMAAVDHLEVGRESIHWKIFWFLHARHGIVLTHRLPRLVLSTILYQLRPLSYGV